MSEQTKHALQQAERAYHEAQERHDNAVAQERRSGKCRRCGASPGRYVCADADRVAFACTNYVKGDL